MLTDVSSATSSNVRKNPPAWTGKGGQLGSAKRLDAPIEPAASRLMVVANRFDGVGARLGAIINAWSIARVLGQEFRFVWPRGGDIGLREPGNLFSSEFLDRFEITEAEYATRRVESGLTGMSVLDARECCQRIDAPSMMRIDECFDVVAFADETPRTAQARFRATLDEISWNTALSSLVRGILNRRIARGYSAIHIRAGDFVTGDWRQFVQIEKYTPTAFVEHAIESLSGDERNPVVVVSDNAPYVRYLKRRFRAIRTPDDIVPGYTGLNELQRAFVDILVLSQARRLVGPRMSAFSQLAVKLGNVSLRSAHELVAEPDARRLLHDHINRAGKQVEQSAVLGPLLVRDICWFLDVFSDDLTFGDTIALARRAARLKSDFCGALNRSASALALAGKPNASRRASSPALAAAATVDRHADPMVESLATYISATAVGLGTRSAGVQGLLERLKLGSIFNARTATFDDIDQWLERCQTLAPYQIHHSEVLLNLRYQVAALRWLTATNSRLRAIAKSVLRSGAPPAPILRGWRPSGFSKLTASGAFPHVLRNLEVVTIRIAHAISTALRATCVPSTPLLHVHGLTATASGMRWVTGWAYDPDIGRRGVAVAYRLGNGVLSAGVTFLPRPDIAENLREPGAENCGFAFPVPLNLPDAAVVSANSDG